jgi:hypothetical protein
MTKLRTEAAIAEWNERVRSEARAEAQQHRRRPDPGPDNPLDALDDRRPTRTPTTRKEPMR